MFQILSAAISNSGQYTSFATRNGVLTGMNLNTREEIWDAFTREHIMRIIYSPDDRHIATIHRSELIIRDAVTGKVQEVLYGHEKYIQDVAFVPGSPLVVACGTDDATIIHNYYTGELVYSFPAHEYKHMTRVACSPDGKYIAVGGWGYRIYVYEIAKNFELLCTLYEYANYISALLWKGKGLISGGTRGNVYIWDIGSGKYLKKFKPPEMVTMIHATSEYLVTCSTNVLRVWHLPDDSEPVCISEIRIKDVYSIGDRGVLCGKEKYTYIQEIPILNFYKVMSGSIPQISQKAIHDPRIVYRISGYIG